LQDDTARETQTLSLKNDTVFIVTVTDEVTGCSASDSIKIYVGLGEGLEGCIVIHNVITPNGDGLNDTWIIDCIENFPDNMVQIFNRWGERVNNYYHYDNKNQVWDGTNYNGELLPAGTYYYVLKIKNLKTWTGWVLLRCGLK
jgi:gliding motility-associated-like protein